MYRYDEFDADLVSQRVDQFRGQVARRLSGELTEDQFKPLRLMNGLYLQLHAYMLRVAIPYGTLSAQQLRKLAHIARTYDRGYGHFTTRQNIQFNWPKLEDVPAILDELASVEMHAIQTSGNCIRNVTADQFAGVTADEIEDPRITAEVIRQWSTLHPEFTFLPRKFKIAVTGAPNDRAAVRFHDIGLQMRRNLAGEPGFEVLVGGGQGRTPVIAEQIRSFLPKEHLLSYLEAILRVYNMLGRRDNLYKARIKILVQQVGIDAFRELVEDEWASMDKQAVDVPEIERQRIEAYFAPPAYEEADPEPPALADRYVAEPEFARWVDTSVADHREEGYGIVTISLKPIGVVDCAPGDASADQMEAVAELADRYSLGEIRVTHEQNLVLPDVKLADLHAVWKVLKAAGLATSNVGLVSDIIACPGLDYCNLANARSIPVAHEIGSRFADLEQQHRIGPLKIKISGCINACGHHHAGDIGILGVDRKGVEFYQITLGGRADEKAAIGQIVGPSFGYEEVTGAVESIVETYLDQRRNGETFAETFDRVGLPPFKEKLYAAH